MKKQKGGKDVGRRKNRNINSSTERKKGWNERQTEGRKKYKRKSTIRREGESVQNINSVAKEENC